jgi:diaminopimelate decarboxylase
MTQFPVVDGCLQVGGSPLTRIAAWVGSTPFYVYDRRLLKERVEKLRTALPKELKLHYAMKANPMPALVCYMAGMVDGLDVASTGEMKVALDSGMAAENISFAGPGKQARELARAIAAGIVINVESAREARQLAEHSSKMGLPARVAVRINPDFELKLSGMKMGGGAKQFGVDAEAVPELLKEIGQMGLAFEGFHIFSGSQSLKAEAICEAQKKSVDMALRLAESAPGPLKLINIGGGFGIPYFPGDKPLDLAPIGEGLSALIEQTAAALPGTELAIELGRYLVGEAGLYVCRVVERKLSRGQVFLIANGGMHHHLAASGNFGQVIRKNYPVALGNRMNEEKTEIASIVGPLCTPLDILADRMELPEAKPGDLIVVFQSGAYGLSASPQAFLSHPLPGEVLV